MRNVQLASFSVIIALCQFGFQQNNSVEDEPKPFCYGFTNWVWVLVVIQAGGGLLVAAIIKYADNVLKGLATGVAVVVSTICSMVLFNTPLTLQFTCGATLILSSVYFFSNDFGGGKKVTTSPPPPPPSTADVESGTSSKDNGNNVEMNPLVK